MGNRMTHGGKREGAGRPALYNENLKPVTAWLTAEQIEWLRERGDVSETIRTIVEEGKMQSVKELQAKVDWLANLVSDIERRQEMEYSADYPSAHYAQCVWNEFEAARKQLDKLTKAS